MHVAKILRQPLTARAKLCKSTGAEGHSSVACKIICQNMSQNVTKNCHIIHSFSKKMPFLNKKASVSTVFSLRRAIRQVVCASRHLALLFAQRGAAGAGSTGTGSVTDGTVRTEIKKLENIT